MGASGKVESRIATSSGRAGSTFKHFGRLLGYVWPHRRYLALALVCILIMAAAYSAGISAMMPVLKIMIEPEGLHGWVYRELAETRLQCDLSAYNSALDRPVAGLPEGTTKILTLEEDSPLREAGLRIGDFLLAVDGVRGTALTVIPTIASNDGNLEITYCQEDIKTYQPGDAGMEQTVAIAAVELDQLTQWQNRALRQVIALIPGGSSPSQRMRTLLVIIGAILAIVLIGNVARVCAGYLTVLINMRAIIDLRRQMYRHVLSLPLSRFSQNTSDTMSMFVQDMGDILRGLNNFFEKVVAEPFKAAGVFVLALRLNWRLTLVLVLVAPFAIVVFRKLGKKIRRANRKLLIGYGQMLGRLESTLTGMRVVKSYTRESHERRQLFRIDRQVLRQQLRMGFIEALTSPLVEVGAFIGGSAAIIYFASQLFSETITPAKFLTMLICLVAISDPLRKLSSVYPKLQRANAAAQRVFELIDSPSEYEADTGRPRLEPIRQSITFDNVTFTYPGANRPAVRDVSLTVHKGETIALVGPNGSGKTTLVSLLPRFFPLDAGRIRIDDQDIGGVTLRSLREQFSLITQESVIFPDTVRENIAYGRPDASEDEIQEAARKAFADEFIRQIPDGYDAVVGEHGATLSGGQRQRIAIARAILRNAPILLFDEATSQVDPESEMKIHQALDAFLKDRTAFVIAHRYSTIAGADRIAVMDDGRIEAVGTHEHLFQSCPLYRRLYETQFREAG